MCLSCAVQLIRGGLYSENLKYPLRQQPKLSFDANITNDARHLIVGNYFYERSDVHYDARPYFFSFNYHVEDKTPVTFLMDKRQIMYKDLSIASESREYFRMGYGLLLPLNVTEQTYQCAFVPDENKIWQKADYQWIYQGPHLYAGFPLITLALVLVSSTFLCCVGRFQVKKHYHGDDTHHTELPKRVFLPGYATNGRYSVLEILHSLISATDSQIIEQCGTDAYYYLWFQKYMMLFVLACACISMPILLPLYYFSNDHEISFKDFAGVTIAAIDFKNNSKIVLVFAVIMTFAVIGCVYLRYLRKLARTVVKSNKNYSSLFTVMVSGLSPKLRNNKQFLAQFRDRYGDAVVDAHICYDLRKLSKLDEEKDRLTSLLEYYQDQLDRTGKRPTVRTGLLKLTHTDALSHYYEQLQKVQTEIDNKENKKSVKGTGYGFVTFSNIAMAQQCVSEHSLSFCGCVIPLWCFDSRWDYNVTPAPESDDVNYNNLTFSGLNIWLRSIVTNSIMTVILLIVYSIVFIASLLHWWKANHQSNIWDLISRYAIAIVLQGVVEMIPELISAVTELVKPLLEILTDYERHHTRHDFRQSVVRKTSFFMTLSIVVLPYFYMYFNGVWKVCFGAKAPFNNYIYYFNHIGIEMITICVVLSTIAKSIELTIAFLRMMFQLYMNKKMQRIEFDYDGAYGFKISFMVLMLVFGALTPLTLIFVLFFYVFTYWVDKYLIMFFYERSHESDGRVVNTVADVSSYYISVFPIYILAILPSLFLVWKTWVIMVPFLIVLAFVLRRLYQQAKIEEVDKIVLGIREANMEEETDEDTFNDLEQASESSEFNFEDEDQFGAAPSATSRRPIRHLSSGSLASRVLSSVRERSIGPERRLTYEDIENVVSHDQLVKLASRYKHPYLRKQVAIRKEDVISQRYDSQM